MKGILIFLSVFIFRALSYSQLSTAYAAASITLRSDEAPKSVLVSNVFTNGTGDKSPVIGIALWQDSGRQFECRSLLQFDYKQLPAVIQHNPQLVSSAELMLYPTPGQQSNSQPIVFYIKRLLQPWTDSFTTWSRQPLAQHADKIKIEIKPGRTKPLRIDVTQMVTNMLLNGNYGFLLAPQDSVSKSDIERWFASAKNENIKVRPVLVINYLTPYSYTKDYYSGRERQLNSTSVSPPPATPAQPARNN